MQTERDEDGGTESGTAGGAERFRWLDLVLPTLVGLGLRLYRIDSQILSGDEVHTVRGAVTRSVGEIVRAWTIEGADYSVPLTAAMRLLMDRGWVVHELAFRAPSLTAGLFVLVAAPWLLAPRIGRPAARMLAWLIAISPFLVLYSRIIRSYLPVVALGLVATLAFLRFFRTGSLRAAAVYVTSGALAVYFHLGAAPFVLAPFAFAGAARFVPADWSGSTDAPGATPLRLTAALAALALAMLAFLAPAANSLRQLAQIHGEGGAPDLAGWLDSGRLLLGSRSVVVASILAAALVRGVAIGFRRQRQLTAYLSTLAVVQAFGLAVLSPNFLYAPNVMARYLMVLLPFALAGVAVGLTAPLGARVDRRLQRAIAAAVLLAVVATGPFVWPQFRTTSFLHSNAFLNFVGDGNRIETTAVPDFYRELAEMPADVRVLEYPWSVVAAHAITAYQRVHDHPVLVAPHKPQPFKDPRIRFPNLVAPDLEPILASPARYLIVHRRLRDEESRTRSDDLLHQRRVQALGIYWENLRRAAAQLEQKARAAWGRPDFDDGAIAVWDLGRVRARTTGRRSEPPPGAQLGLRSRSTKRSVLPRIVGSNT